MKGIVSKINTNMTTKLLFCIFGQHIPMFASHSWFKRKRRQLIGNNYLLDEAIDVRSISLLMHCLIL